MSALAILAGAVCFLIAITILWGSLVGKLRLRDQIVKSLNLHCDEKVLGVGCGHGLLMIAAAKKLNKGSKAIGVDIWKKLDQTGNSPDATMRNAEIEGVAKRIELTTGDARKLPFANQTFDLIGSS